MKRTFKWLIVVVIVTLAGCDLKDDLRNAPSEVGRAAESTEAVLRDALSSIDRDSERWREALEEAQRRLTSDTQSTIRNELRDLVAGSIAVSGAEGRCNSDFIARRVRDTLAEMLARLRGEDPAPLMPAVCTVVPSAIDPTLVSGRLKMVEFYGYDFDGYRIRAKMEGRDGLEREVTRHLSRPSRYQMVLNLAGNGVPLGEEYDRIVLYAGDRVLSQVAILQEDVPLCARREVHAADGMQITFRPPKQGRGDRDFFGHGPVVEARITLSHDDRSLRAKVFMKAKEIGGDGTRAEGFQEYTLYTAPAGWRIERVPGDLRVNHRYTDGDQSDDKFYLGAGGPVQRIDYRGDRYGDDAGVYTQMTVFFNPIRIELVQSEGCVLHKQLRKLESKGLVSPGRLHEILSRTGRR